MAAISNISSATHQSLEKEQNSKSSAFVADALQLANSLFRKKTPEKRILCPVRRLCVLSSATFNFSYGINLAKDKKLTLLPIIGSIANPIRINWNKTVLPIQVCEGFIKEFECETA